MEAPGVGAMGAGGCGVGFATTTRGGAGAGAGEGSGTGEGAGGGARSSETTTSVTAPRPTDTRRENAPCSADEDSTSASPGSTAAVKVAPRARSRSRPARRTRRVSGELAGTTTRTRPRAAQVAVTSAPQPCITRPLSALPRSDCTSATQSVALSHASRARPRACCSCAMDMRSPGRICRAPARRKRSSAAAWSPASRAEMPRSMSARREGVCAWAAAERASVVATRSSGRMGHISSARRRGSEVSTPGVRARRGR